MIIKILFLVEISIWSRFSQWPYIRDFGVYKISFHDCYILLIITRVFSYFYLEEKMLIQQTFNLIFLASMNIMSTKVLIISIFNLSIVPIKTSIFTSNLSCLFTRSFAFDCVILFDDIVTTCNKGQQQRKISSHSLACLHSI